MRWTIAVVGALALGAGAWMWLDRGDAAEAGVPDVAPRDAGTHDAAADELPPSERLALLVGIDEYDGIDPLRGCVRDVQRAATLLETRFGFAGRDVRVLTNREATHEAIVRAFDEHLIRRATPTSEVVFWFSGHGSRVPDVDGEEQELDGMDSSLLAWDSRAVGRPGEYDLVDDELGALVAALTRITPRVVVITDSCHSGGGVRGHVELRPRGIPPGERPLDKDRVNAFWPADVAQLAPGGLDGRDYVHLAACAPDQLAYEYTYEDAEGRTVRQGLLSFFLADVLDRCPPGISWRRLADEVASRVAAERPGQTVWAAGALERVVFQDRFEARLPGFTGHTLLDKVVVEAGRVHGLERGARLAVELNLSLDGSTLGEVELEKVQATSSLGRWVEEPPALGGRTAIRATLTERSMARRPLLVHVDGVDPGLLPDGVAQRVEQPDLAQAFLRTDAAGVPSLFDFHGHRLWSQADRDLSLRDEIVMELEWRSLYAMAEEPGELAVWVELEDLEEGEMLALNQRFRRSYGPSRTLEASDGHAGVEYVATGGPDDEHPLLARLTVTNGEQEDLYLIVVSVAEHRGTFVIYPDTEHPQENKLPPGGIERIPVGFVAPESWDLERPMYDRYLAIVTRQWVDANAFNKPRRVRGAGDEREKMLVTYPAPLRHALDRKATTRGIETEPESGGAGYGIGVMDVLVKPGY